LVQGEAEPRIGWKTSAGEADELLGFFAGAEDRHAGDAAADHGDFVATMQARAVLAILEYFVGKLRFVLDDAEAIFEKEVGNAGEEADGLDAVLFGLFNERAKDAATRALALGFRLDDDGADFAEVRTVEVERAAAEEDAAVGLGHGEIADVFADFGEGALEQRAVAGERIHQVVDVRGVLEQGLTHPHGQPPRS